MTHLPCALVLNGAVTLAAGAVASASAHWCRAAGRTEPGQASPLARRMTCTIPAMISVSPKSFGV